MEHKQLPDFVKENLCINCIYCKMSRHAASSGIRTCTHPVFGEDTPKASIFSHPFCTDCVKK